MSRFSCSRIHSILAGAKVVAPSESGLDRPGKIANDEHVRRLEPLRHRRTAINESCLILGQIFLNGFEILRSESQILNSCLGLEPLNTHMHLRSLPSCPQVGLVLGPFRCLLIFLSDTKQGVLVERLGDQLEADW